MSSDPDEDPEEIGPDKLFEHITICVFELNLILRAAAMMGEPVPLDLAESTDSVTGLTFTRVIVVRPPADAAE